MKIQALIITSLLTLTGAGLAQQGPVPKGVTPLDHVFLIMMENHGYSEILNNPNAPFINSYAQQANLATNYFAVAHPSLTNYLETVGGSNFGVLSDNAPDRHNASRTTNSPPPGRSEKPPRKTWRCPARTQSTIAMATSRTSRISPRSTRN